MSSLLPANRVGGLTLRQAALVAGFSMLLMSAVAPFANFFVFAKLVYPGNIEQTIQNIAANRVLFVAGIFAYLVNYICDVLIAWALYVLLAPVNQSLSLLAAWFRLVFTALGLFGVLKLVTAFRLLNSADYLVLFGSAPLHAQVQLLLLSAQYDWSFDLILFGIHLGLLGYLVYRSRYIPWFIGILLALAGLGWIINSLRPYLFPNAHLGFLMITSFAELIFMLWLLIIGWRIREPDVQDRNTATV